MNVTPIKTFDGRSEALADDAHISLLLTWQLDEDNHGRAWPTRPITINGHSVHVYALRVNNTDDGQYAWTDDADGVALHADELDNLQQWADGQLEAFSLPGLEGEWIIAAHSFGD